MRYEDVQIQLVDLPPVSRDYCESFVFDNIKACDGALLVLDLGAGDPVEDFNETLDILKAKKITLVPPEAGIHESESGVPDIQSLLVFNKCQPVFILHRQVN